MTGYIQAIVCKWCGHQPEIVEGHTMYGVAYYNASCQNCDVMFREESRDEVIKLWNDYMVKHG